MQLCFLFFLANRDRITINNPTATLTYQAKVDPAFFKFIGWLSEENTWYLLIIASKAAKASALRASQQSTRIRVDSAVYFGVDSQLGLRLFSLVCALSFFTGLLSLCNATLLS
jgi:hypothetical protein